MQNHRKDSVKDLTFQWQNFKEYWEYTCSQWIDNRINDKPSEQFKNFIVKCIDYIANETIVKKNMIVTELLQERGTTRLLKDFKLFKDI